MDEFAVETTVIYAAVIGLLILLTYLEASLLQPQSGKRRSKRRFSWRRHRKTSSEPQPPDPADQA